MPQGNQLADVVPLAHAPRTEQQQQQPEELETEKQQLQHGFDAIIEPLEAQSGSRLGGVGRTICLAAYRANAGGFARCAADALERGTSPIGLLVQMVKDKDHLAPAPPERDEHQLLRRRIAERADPDADRAEKVRRRALLEAERLGLGDQ